MTATSHLLVCPDSTLKIRYMPKKKALQKIEKCTVYHMEKKSMDMDWNIYLFSKCSSTLTKLLPLLSGIVTAPQTAWITPIVTKPIQAP